jgi:uncharacterized membrane protein YgcG
MRLPAVRWALRGELSKVIPDMEANVVEVSGECLYCLFRCMTMFLAAIGVINGYRYWRSPLEALRLHRESRRNQIQSLTASFRAGGGGGGSTSGTSGGGSTGGGG